jgi:hypothetical protein
MPGENPAPRALHNETMEHKEREMNDKRGFQQIAER